jgi:hypothetical protein
MEIAKSYGKKRMNRGVIELQKVGVILEAANKDGRIVRQKRTC